MELSYSAHIHDMCLELQGRTFKMKQREKEKMKWRVSKNFLCHFLYLPILLWSWKQRCCPSRGLMGAIDRFTWMSGQWKIFGILVYLHSFGFTSLLTQDYSTMVRNSSLAFVAFPLSFITENSGEMKSLLRLLPAFRDHLRGMQK